MREDVVRFGEDVKRESAGLFEESREWLVEGQRGRLLSWAVVWGIEGRERKEKTVWSVVWRQES